MDFENRVLNRCFANAEHLATLSKHELLFGFSKAARYWNAGVLQVVQLILTICVAWTLMAIFSELSVVMVLLGDV